MNGSGVQVCRLQGYVLSCGSDGDCGEACSEVCGGGCDAAAEGATPAEGFVTECVQRGKAAPDSGRRVRKRETRGKKVRGWERVGG